MYACHAANDRSNKKALFDDSQLEDGSMNNVFEDSPPQDRLRHHSMPQRPLRYDSLEQATNDRHLRQCSESTNPKGLIGRYSADPCKAGFAAALPTAETINESQPLMTPQPRLSQSSSRSPEKSSDDSVASGRTPVWHRRVPEDEYLAPQQLAQTPKYVDLCEGRPLHCVF